MKKFVVERNLPGAGNLTAEELQSIAQLSSEVITSLASHIIGYSPLLPMIKFIVFTLQKAKK